jgi:hypothetical protein
LDAVVIPVGGGGLIAGIGAAIKARRPEVAVYGVEAAQVPSMKEALRLGAPVTLPRARTMADGISARRVSDRTFELAQRYFDEIVLVDEEEIAEAILSLLEQEKTVAEGAGAAALAGVLQGELPISGQRVVALVSGGNIDVNLLSRILDRGLVKSGRCMRMWVMISDQPGSLAALLASIAGLNANVLQIHHDRLAARTEPGLTTVELVLETRGFDHIASAARRAEPPRAPRRAGGSRALRARVGTTRRLGAGTPWNHFYFGDAKMCQHVSTVPTCARMGQLLGLRPCSSVTSSSGCLAGAPLATCTWRATACSAIGSWRSSASRRASMTLFARRSSGSSRPWRRSRCRG